MIVMITIQLLIKISYKIHEFILYTEPIKFIYVIKSLFFDIVFVVFKNIDKLK